MSQENEHDEELLDGAIRSLEEKAGAEFSGFHSDQLIESASRHQLIYSVLGLASILGGILLFLAGVTGKMSWSAKFLGATSEMLDAAPGAVLLVVGLIIVFVTRYKSRR